jgi:hypothetical protein
VRLLAQDEREEPGLAVDGATGAQQTGVALARGEVGRARVVRVGVVALVGRRVGEVGEGQREDLLADLGRDAVEQEAVILRGGGDGEDAGVERVCHFAMMVMRRCWLRIGDF